MTTAQHNKGHPYPEHCIHCVKEQLAAREKDYREVVMDFGSWRETHGLQTAVIADLQKRLADAEERASKAEEITECIAVVAALFCQKCRDKHCAECSTAALKAEREIGDRLASALRALIFKAPDASKSRNGLEEQIRTALSNYDLRRV